MKNLAVAVGGAILVAVVAMVSMHVTASPSEPQPMPTSTVSPICQHLGAQLAQAQADMRTASKYNAPTAWFKAVDRESALETQYQAAGCKY